MLCDLLMYVIVLCSCCRLLTSDIAVSLDDVDVCSRCRNLGMQGGRASRGTLGGPGDLAAAVCRVGGPGGLFLKSNDPNLSGGEKHAQGPRPSNLEGWRSGAGA